MKNQKHKTMKSIVILLLCLYIYIEYYISRHPDPSNTLYQLLIFLTGLVLYLIGLLLTKKMIIVLSVLFNMVFLIIMLLSYFVILYMGGMPNNSELNRGMIWTIVDIFIIVHSLMIIFDI